MPPRLVDQCAPYSDGPLPDPPVEVPRSSRPIRSSTRRAGAWTWRAGPRPGSVTSSSRCVFAASEWSSGVGVVPTRQFPSHLIRARHQCAITVDEVRPEDRRPCPAVLVRLRGGGHRFRARYSSGGFADDQSQGHRLHPREDQRETGNRRLLALSRLHASQRDQSRQAPFQKFQKHANGYPRGAFPPGRAIQVRLHHPSFVDAGRRSCPLRLLVAAPPAGPGVAATVGPAASERGSFGGGAAPLSLPRQRTGGRRWL